MSNRYKELAVKSAELSLNYISGQKLGDVETAYLALRKDHISQRALESLFELDFADAEQLFEERRKGARQDVAAAAGEKDGKDGQQSAGNVKAATVNQDSPVIPNAGNAPPAPPQTPQGTMGAAAAVPAVPRPEQAAMTPAQRRMNEIKAAASAKRIGAPAQGRASAEVKKRKSTGRTRKGGLKFLPNGLAAPGPGETLEVFDTVPDKVSDTLRPLAEPLAGSWQCGKCSSHNHTYVKFCRGFIGEDRCTGIKTTDTIYTTPTTGYVKPDYDPAHGEWLCKYCGAWNPEAERTCQGEAEHLPGGICWAPFEKAAEYIHRDTRKMIAQSNRRGPPQFWEPSYNPRGKFGNRGFPRYDRGDDYGVDDDEEA